MSDPAAHEEHLQDHRSYTRLAYGAILLVFGGFGAWAAIAPLDSAAIAPARIAVEGDRKPVQHLEGGIVREVLVKDADTVTEGQVLFRLDPTAARANFDVLGRQLDSLLAQEARLVAEREGRPTITFPGGLLAKTGRPDIQLIMTEQERLLNERRRSLESQIGLLETRIDQTDRDIEGRNRRLAALKTQLASLKAEIDSVQPLVDKGFFPRNRLRALEREASRFDGDIGGLEGELARLEQVIEESRIQIRQTRQRAAEEQTQALSDIRARIAELREKVDVAETVLSRLDVRAPRAGIVLNMSVKTPGAVVSPGSTLAEVVPPLERLTLTARISPLNVQSISPGQRAEVRFPAFAARKPEPIFGKVETVSADAVEDPRTRETFYSAKVVVEPGAMPEALAKQLVPGMPADVLIITGERTMLTYILGPLRDRFAKAMRDE